MTGAYAEFLWNMRRPDRNDSDSIYSFKPTRIKETIGHFAPRFATSDQQDAQEFMTFVLDTIHDELEEKNKPDGRYLSHLFNHIVVITTNSEGQLKFETPLSRLSEHEVTLIEQEDYTNRIRPDQFDEEPDSLRLEECLQEFVSLERLHDLWFCQQDTCKRHTHATKQLQFNSLPLVLVIQLKRFSYTDAWRRKLN